MPLKSNKNLTPKKVCFAQASCPAPSIAYWTCWSIQSSLGIFFHYTQWTCQPLKTSYIHTNTKLTCKLCQWLQKTNHCFSFENFYCYWLKRSIVYCRLLIHNWFSGTASQTTQAASALSGLFSHLLPNPLTKCVDNLRYHAGCQCQKEGTDLIFLPQPPCLTDSTLKIHIFCCIIVFILPLGTRWLQTKKF